MIAVVGIHLAVLGAILTLPPLRSEIELPEAGEVRFVEVAAELIDAAPAINRVDEAAAPVQHANAALAPPQPEDAMPDEAVEEEPEAEITREPVMQEPEPEPKLKPEPEPEPEPIAEPATDPLREPKPESKVEPRPEPPPIVEPKIEPKIEPKPPVNSKVVPKPVHKPKPNLKARVQPTPSSAARQASDSVALDGQSQLAAVPSALVSPADADRPRMIGKVDYLGRRPSPDYPRASVRRGETGRVVVRVLISAQGAVADARLRKSSGHERLDESALKAARSARFKPYTENGVPYPAMADIPFDFVL